MSRLASLLLALLLAPFLASAQAERTFRVIYLDAPADAPKSMQLFDGRDSREIKLPKMNLSPVYKLRSGPVELRLLEKPPTDKANVPADSPHASISVGLTDFILLVMRESRKNEGDGGESGEGAPPDESDAADDTGEMNGAEVLTLKIIEVDPAKFKKGGILWCNLTDNRIKGSLGDEELTLEPKSQAVIDDPAVGGESFLVKLSFSTPDDDQLRPLSETKWLHYSKGRIVQFVLEEPGSIVPRLLGVADNR